MIALAQSVRGTRNADAISVTFCLTHNQTKTQSVDSLCVKQLSDKSTDGPQLAEATELGVVLESRTAAAVVSQLNRHQCDPRTHGENTRRAGRDQVAE
jgi:hypothetical protein